MSLLSAGARWTECQTAFDWQVLWTISASCYCDNDAISLYSLRVRLQRSAKRIQPWIRRRRFGCTLYYVNSHIIPLCRYIRLNPVHPLRQYSSTVRYIWGEQWSCHEMDKVLKEGTWSLGCGNPTETETSVIQDGCKIFRFDGRTRHEMDGLQSYLKLNTNKSYEMIVHHPSKKLTSVPPLLEKIIRTHELTVLGVTFNSTLSFSQHVQNLIAKAATALYALKTLKAHGLQGRALWEVTQTTLMAQITYASPSWRGFIKAEEVARLKAILLKARWYGYLPADFLSLEDLLDSSDESLFAATRYNPQYVLHQLLPPPKHTGYNLRSHGHSLTLSVIPSEYKRKNSVNRMLYSDIY